ncbi:helix-turn-helix transcriptional regulator [Pararobbsia silviterrae]|uniref:AraC family transcriptional regulator n=1 Tax=Pararobbsia silviterrae TaxID=1792498 RepID=A0A494X8Q3_9BURK|nr:AraC family transcriptional regulator [Pararobbsia silviterrae]RKP47095.1 AraC family transcriptional regulator [Pararobbsia silviterrae]
MDLRQKSVSAHILKMFLASAERHGLDPNQLRAFVGVTDAELAHADARVPGDKHLKMLAFAKGLHLREHAGEGDMPGWFAHFPELAGIVMNGATLREALRDFIEYRDFVGNVDWLLAQEAGTEIVFDYVLDGTSRDAGCVLGNFAMITSIAKLYDADIGIRDVSITADDIKGLASIGDAIGAHVRLGQPRNRLVIESSALDRPFEIYNAALAKSQRPAAREKLARIRESGQFAPMVARCVRESLALQADRVESKALQAVVCERLDVTRWVLQRRLAAEGSTFSDVLARTRAEEACRLLEHTSMPIREISERVGYQSTIAFTNFFTQSQGISPARYRDRHRFSR